MLAMDHWAAYLTLFPVVLVSLFALLYAIALMPRPNESELESIHLRAYETGESTLLIHVRGRGMSGTEAPFACSQR